MSAVDGFVPRIGGYLLSTVSCGIDKLDKRVKAQDTSAESKPDLPLEIAHLLLIDVVGYSKLLVNEQIELLQELNQIVRGTECFRAAEATGKLIRVPTGDGMALVAHVVEGSVQRAANRARMSARVREESVVMSSRSTADT
jgi:hypothetical protein